MIIDPKTSEALSAKWWKAIALMLIVAFVNSVLWTFAFRAQAISVLPNKLSGVAYAPFREGQSPLTGTFPSLQEIDEDLQLLSHYTQAIRLYSVQDLPEIPVIAQKYGLKVNQGAWLNRDLENNQRELDALYVGVQRAPNINAVIVGNETILRGDSDAVEKLFGPSARTVRSADFDGRKLGSMAEFAGTGRSCRLHCCARITLLGRGAS
jgi:exo-beta-1,3-glucanase (GH17 family)